MAKFKVAVAGTSHPDRIVAEYIDIEHGCLCFTRDLREGICLAYAPGEWKSVYREVDKIEPSRREQIPIYGDKSMDPLEIIEGHYD